jgi:Zn-dependent metalloprotease
VGAAARPGALIVRCAVCLGAAVLAIGLSLIAIGGLTLVAGAGGGRLALSGHALHVAAEDAAVVFYVTQLVGVSFFDHTAGLRFAALPGLLLIGLAIATASLVAARVARGSVRSRMLLAASTALPYAVLTGLGALYVPLRFTAPAVGHDVAVLPSTIEAFVLPLAWGLLFAPAGALVGVFGRAWRREAKRMLGAWATPLRCSLRALAAGVALSAVAALVGGAVLLGRSGEARSLFGGGLGHALTGIATALIALPTLVLSLFLACFGVSFDWQAEALNRTHGSGSILGGTLPSAGASPTHGIPAALALLLLLAAATVLAAGWLTARRSGEDVRLSLANALRTGALMTLICWLFGLVARADAQAGGFLGFQFEPDTASLLLRVPLWCFLGSATGSVAYLATRGAASRRRLVAALLALAHPVGWPRQLHRPLTSWHRGLARPAALGAGFLSLPAMLLGMGSAGAATSTQPAAVSLAPISRAAEQRFRRDAVPGSGLSVVVDPNTRLIDSAIVHVPLSSLGIAAAEPAAVKARAVLAHYGDLFGASDPNELGEAHVLTDRATRIASSVDFAQTVRSVPVYGDGIGVHFSRNGRYLDFIDGSFVPEVSLANDRATLGSARAIALAKAALPAGRLVHAPRLEVYAGSQGRQFGPTARLAWFVWLSAGPLRASNEYVIDASTGGILDTIVKSFNSEDRKIYSAEETKELLRKLLRVEGEEPNKDAEVNNAYNHLGEAFKFFAQIEEEGAYHWEGYNGKGEPEIGTVHYGKEAKVAEWDGALQEVYFGTEDAKESDVVAHEYSDGVTEASAKEEDKGQSGAVAEGFADAMGKATESYEKVRGKLEKHETPTKAEEEPSSWIYGKEFGTPRDLAKPEEYDELEGHHDPEKLGQYVSTCEDNEGVHENSTILSHAFYLLAKESTVMEAAKVFFLMQVEELRAGGTMATLKRAAVAAVDAARQIRGEKSALEKDTTAAFEKVGLYGPEAEAEPVPPDCTTGSPKCTMDTVLQAQEPAHGMAATLSMLATLYRARGALAQTSAAGRHFMPLYEANMGRITELVSRDPTLEATSVEGLQQISPALNALSEGEGQKFKLTTSEMAEIEASLKRLAQDDRLFSGGGQLAILIERELKWLRLHSYAGLTYAKGFARLNTEVVRNTETPPPTGSLVDRECSGTPYNNGFRIDGFTVDTPHHYKPEEVSPLVASGVVCGTQVEVEGLPTECHDAKHSLNTEITVELPPGDQVNSNGTKEKEIKYNSYLGKAYGVAFACAGDRSEMVEGRVAIKAREPGTGECPASAIGCYEVEGSFDGHTGHGYAWVKKEESGRLALTTGTVIVDVEEKGSKAEVPVGFSQFAIELCARAGEPGTETCGTPKATWVHKNGSESQPECPGETANGRYTVYAKNKEGETTPKTSWCVYWGERKHEQEVDAGNAVNGASCVPGTTDCIVTDSKGNALYSTNVSATEAAKWESWSGLTSPGEAVACPSSSLCVLGDGKATEGGGNMYYATSLGGTWKEAFKPTYGVLSISCPSASFCVDGQKGGRIRYSTSPASTSWTEVTGIGSTAINGIFCLSTKFCAAVNGSGELLIADTEAKIKETSGWKASDIDGSTALDGVACTSETSCVAVDGAGKVIKLTINGSGEAKEPAKLDLDGTGDLTATTCVGRFTCVAVDNAGNVFVSTSAGEAWKRQFALGKELTSVACSSRELCVTGDKTGHVTAFTPSSAPPSRTAKIDSSNSVKAISCVPEATDCVVSDSAGDALYSTGVSAIPSTSVEWTSWSGPTGASPSEAIACPTSSLCTLADGHVSGGTGGLMYYATSFGGSWTNAFSPAYGVVAISCSSSSFCVDSQEGAGYIRYTTKPASSEWTSVSIGSGAMNAVDCLSSSFCAVADNSGHVHIADSEAKVKEAAGWKSTDIDGSTSLNGVACASTEYCVAIDDTGDVLEFTVNSSGEATVYSKEKEDIDGTNKLTAVTCTGGSTCVAVDNAGNVFVSEDSGETWQNRLTLGAELVSVSCSSKELCLVGDTTGKVTAFEPE